MRPRRRIRKHARQCHVPRRPTNLKTQFTDNRMAVEEFGNLVGAEDRQTVYRTRTTLGYRSYRRTMNEMNFRGAANRFPRSWTIPRLPPRPGIVKMLFFNLGDAARLIYGFNSRISFRGWSFPALRGVHRQRSIQKS